MNVIVENLQIILTGIIAAACVITAIMSILNHIGKCHKQSNKIEALKKEVEQLKNKYTSNPLDYVAGKQYAIKSLKLQKLMKKGGAK